MRTTLWVTTAAAALIAGATFAGAQTGKTNEKGASSGSSQMGQSQGSTQKGAASEQKGAKPGMAQGKEERTEKKGIEGNKQPGTAQGKEAAEKKGVESKEQRSTQAGEKAKGPTGAEKGKPGMAQEKGGAQTGQSSTGQQKPSTQTQTQPGTTSKGTTSGSASTSSSGSVQLSQEQKTKVHDVVVKESSARVDQVDFSISVGTAVPQRIHVKARPLPPVLVEIVPQYRTYLYFIVRDEIVIVDPNTFRIVAIIPV
jgi:Protein of unknown function (DUF1236)